MSAKDSRRRQRWQEKRKRRIQALLERDPHVCHYCQTPLAVDGKGYQWHSSGEFMLLSPGYAACHIDHVIPIAAGGSDDLENLVLSCDKCNVAKGAK